MPKGLSKATVAIQRLLDERQQIQVWLQRISMTADNTPEQVRAKVRTDYERRLGEVMRELQEHGSELNGTLDRLRATEGVLAKQEKESAERLAEAELRHAVGEYDEGQWRQVHADMLGALVKIREELKQAGDEIARLREVMTLIDAGARPTPPRAAREQPPVEPPSKKSVAAQEPRDPARAPGQPAEAFDELAFLRSVTEDETHGPAPSRASGAMRAVEDQPPASAPARQGQGADGEGKKETAARGGKGTKTLKCGECGTMNLPTEWYCENCGAELAAL